MSGLIKYTLVISIVITIIILGINLYIITITKDNIKKTDMITDNVDCIIILGAGIRNGKPSPMLEDRLLTGIDLYNKKVSNKIIVSGDHGRNNYDEVNIMKDYLINKGIPSENIFMDHAGFSTYDSLYRAKEIFKVKKAVIVTQKYHLFRALYVGEKLNLETIGVSADKRRYFNQIKRDIREIAARVKDFIKCIFKPESKYLGEEIPVNGNGDITNDKR